MSGPGERERRLSESLLAFQREALARVRAELDSAEADAVSKMREKCGDYSRKVRGVRERLADSRRKLDAAADAFRAKLLSGPVTEEEFRARTVILEMEHESRLRTAEEGLAVLSEAFDAFADAEAERLRTLTGRLEKALGERWAVPGKEILASLREAEASRASVERENARLRAEAEKSENLAGERESRESQALREELERLSAEWKNKERALTDALRETGNKESAREAEASRAAAELEDHLAKQEALYSERIERLQRVLEKAWAKVQENGEVKDRLRRVEEAFAQAQAESRRLGVIRGRLEEQRDEAQAESTRLERELFEAREEILVLRGKVDAAVEAARSVSGALEKELKERDEECARLKDEIGRLEARTAALEPRAAPDDGTVRRLEAALKEAQEALRAAEKTSGSAARERDEAFRQRDSALQARDEAAAALEEQKNRIKGLQRTYLAADVGRDRLKAEREREWEAEKEDYEERLSQAVREINTLRATFQESQRTWEESYARQDGMRMQEIFRLKSELERLRPSGDKG